MKRELRALAMFTCITAAAAFGGESAFAEYGRPSDRPGAGAGEMHGQKGHRKGKFFAKMAAELKLTEPQKAQAKELFEKGRAEHKPLREALTGERQRLRDLIHSGNADEAAIRAQAAKVAAVQSDLAVQRGEQAKHFLALLTPDQATKLKELQQKRKGRPSGARCDDFMQP